MTHDELLSRMELLRAFAICGIVQLELTPENRAEQVKFVNETINACKGWFTHKTWDDGL